MSGETVLTNAHLVLGDEVIRGTLTVRGGMIADVQPGESRLPGAMDMQGDYVIAGVIDLHTDNLERQVQPRSNARWPSRSALIAHDSQCAAAGVTTVLDALCLGDLGFDKDRVRTFREGIADIDALADAGLLRAEHFLHLRCEVPADDMLGLFEPVSEHPRLRMVSLMDHTPGVGQYADLDYYRALRRTLGAAEEEIERRMVELVANRLRVRGPNRRAVLSRLAGRGIALASHDDRTEEEVAENAADGIRVSEFPVTREAALAAKAAGMAVIAGAPNVVRGGSHSGNVAVSRLIEAGAVDALASDYVPTSLVEAAFGSARRGFAAAGGDRAHHRGARRDRRPRRSRPSRAGPARRSRARAPAWRSAGGARRLAGGRAGGVIPYRVAAYYAPNAADKLFAAGATWLGRDPESGASCPQPGVDGIAEFTAEPRLYGFHATLKPPMRLTSDIWNALRTAAKEIAASTAPFDLPPLAVADLRGFLALRETVPSPPLQAFADLCIAGLDGFRTPLEPDELARRRRGRLSRIEDLLLQRWGYPWVFGAWFFHMTLTRRLTEAERDRILPAAEHHFAPALAISRRVATLCLFVQEAPGQPFLIAERLALG